MLPSDTLQYFQTHVEESIFEWLGKPRAQDYMGLDVILDIGGIRIYLENEKL